MSKISKVSVIKVFRTIIPFCDHVQYPEPSARLRTKPYAQLEVTDDGGRFGKFVTVQENENGILFIIYKRKRYPVENIGSITEPKWVVYEPNEGEKI